MTTSNDTKAATGKPAVAPQLLTASEFAARISWHPESVRRAIRDGRLRAVKCGSDWRLNAAELARVCAEGIE